MASCREDTYNALLLILLQVTLTKPLSSFTQKLQVTENSETLPSRLVWLGLFQSSKITDFKFEFDLKCENRKRRESEGEGSNKKMFLVTWQGVMGDMRWKCDKKWGQVENEGNLEKNKIIRDLLQSLGILKWRKFLKMKNNIFGFWFKVTMKFSYQKSVN